MAREIQIVIALDREWAIEDPGSWSTLSLGKLRENVKAYMQARPLADSVLWGAA